MLADFLRRLLRASPLSTNRLASAHVCLFVIVAYEECDGAIIVLARRSDYINTSAHGSFKSLTFSVLPIKLIIVSMRACMYSSAYMVSL